MIEPTEYFPFQPLTLLSLCCLQVAPGEHFDADAPSTSASAANGKRKRPTGRVVGVIKRNWRARGYCGALKPPDSGRSGHGGSSVLFIPVERRYPMIRIHTRQVRSTPGIRIQARPYYPDPHPVGRGADGQEDGRRDRRVGGKRLSGSAASGISRPASLLENPLHTPFSGGLHVPLRTLR